MSKDRVTVTIDRKAFNKAFAKASARVSSSALMAFVGASNFTTHIGVLIADELERELFGKTGSDTDDINKLLKNILGY